jgi:hypothetical protein
VSGVSWTILDRKTPVFSRVVQDVHDVQDVFNFFLFFNDTALYAEKRKYIRDIRNYLGHLGH